MGGGGNGGSEGAWRRALPYTGSRCRPDVYIYGPGRVYVGFVFAGQIFNPDGRKEGNLGQLPPRPPNPPSPPATGRAGVEQRDISASE